MLTKVIKQNRSILDVQSYRFARSVNTQKAMARTKSSMLDNQNTETREATPTVGALNEKINLRRAQFSAEFEGMPLIRREPESEQSTMEVLVKTRFSTQKQLFDFYEKHRNQFSEIEMFTILLSKLNATSLNNQQTDLTKNEKNNVSQIHAVQLKMIANDYSKVQKI